MCEMELGMGALCEKRWFTDNLVYLFVFLNLALTFL